MTEPTDDELDAVIAEYQTRIYPQDMHPRFERAIMRAAIAKFGTPPAVTAEPVGVVGYTVHGTQYVNWLSKAPAHGTPIYTAPQPTQAQAGAVPLTADEREALWESHGPTRVKWGHWEWHQQGIEDAERHHGIKGGQHG